MSDSAQHGAQRPRAADTDRIEVAQLLTDAAAQGRLKMSDYQDRLTKAYAAKTYDDLDRLHADLLGSTVSPRRGGACKPAPSTLLLAIMGAFERRGRWNVPKKLTTFALWGGGVIDLRYADFTSTEVEIRAYSIMGVQTILLPPGSQCGHPRPRGDGRLRPHRHRPGHARCTQGDGPRLLAVGRCGHQAEEPQVPELATAASQRRRRRYRK